MSRFDIAYLRGNPLTEFSDPSPQKEYSRRAEQQAVVPDATDPTKVTLYQMEDILFVNRNADVVGSGTAGPEMRDNFLLIPLDIDGLDHRKFRRLLDPLFAPQSKQSRISAIEPIVRRRANELIDQFVDKGEAELLRDFCEQLPSTIFLDMMGLPQGDLEFLAAFKEAIIRPKGTTREEIAASYADWSDKLVAYINKAMEDRENQEGGPGDDLLSGLMTAEVDGARLSKDELVNIIYLFIIAGLDTVTSSLACQLAYLAGNQEAQQQLRDDPSLIPNAVEELMRYESPVPQSYRYTNEDLELPSGNTIKAGTYMRAVSAAANVDPAVFPDPLTVDFNRPKMRHIAFSSGTHRCLGSHLARLEMVAALDELHRRIGTYRLKEVPEWTNMSVRSPLSIHVEFEKK